MHIHLGSSSLYAMSSQVDIMVKRTIIMIIEQGVLRNVFPLVGTTQSKVRDLSVDVILGFLLLDCY